MFVARSLAIKQNVIKDFKKAFQPIVIPILIVCGLILPANFSTAALIFATTWILMFIGRVNLKYLFGLVGVGLILFTIFIAIVMTSDNTGRIGTWKNRIENFTSGESESNYQAEQAKIAIGSGRVLGKGLGRGSQTQYGFLPESQTDFIFASSCNSIAVHLFTNLFLEVINP